MAAYCVGFGSAPGQRPSMAPARPTDFPHNAHALVAMPASGTAATASDAAPRTPVFVARHLTKIYRMGEVEVQRLAGCRPRDLSRASSSCCSGPRAAASRRCSTSSAGSTCRPRGEAFWRDHDLAGAGEQELTRYRREHVGFVFQFYNLIPSLTVRENVALVTDIAPQPDDARTRRSSSWASAPRANHFPSQLSGGEQQRVAIARADRQAARRAAVRRADRRARLRTGMVVLEAIARINRELGTTAVVITHNAVIAGMADRVIHLADGRITHVDVNTRKLTPAELSW